jgi:ribosomal protein S18 acetylase RimI-like enzyme
MNGGGKIAVGCGVDELKIHLSPGMRNAERGDADQLADITSEALREDPFDKWLFGGREPMRKTFRTLAHAVYLPRGICHLVGDSGATMWLPPGASKDLPILTMARLSLSILTASDFGALPRIMKADQSMESRMPNTPHLYLFTIGVRDSARGTGVGRRLMTPVLEAADSAALPVYLESTNPANHGFYASMGFEGLEIFEPVAGSPPVEMMWREPQLSGKPRETAPTVGLGRAQASR